MISAPRKAIEGLLIGLGCAILVGALYSSGALESIELLTLDLRFRLAAHTAVATPPDNVVIVTLDQSSIEEVHRKIGQRWPWPREFYGKMIDFLAWSGARAVLFDVFFSEPDINRADISGEASDAALAAATARSGRVFHAYVLEKLGFPPPEDKRAALAAMMGEMPLDGAQNLRPEVFGTAALPEPALFRAGRFVGFANVMPERDNIFRRVPLLAKLKGQWVVSLSLAGAWDLAGRPPVRVTPGRLSFGNTRVPIDDRAQPFLWWYRPSTNTGSAFAHIPAESVLRSGVQLGAKVKTELSPALFTNKIVVIGATAPGLFDVRATPLSRGSPGVEIQATALANLLRDDFVTRLPRHGVLAAVLLLSLGLGAGLSAVKRLSGQAAIAGGLLAVTVAAAYWLLAAHKVFVDLVPLLAGGASTFVAVTCVNYISERRHSKLVRNIFEHYLDPSVVKTLIADPDRVRLGGEKRVCTVLFTDLANFTNTSEKLPAEDVVKLMNIYLNAMTEIIIDEGGFVDKFIGDEIVALYGAPNDLPDHAERAVRSVLRMQARTRELQDEFKTFGCKGEIFARSGVNTGELVVGNMGSEDRMNYTGMGDVMNTGARMEGANKVYGTRVMTSEATTVAAGPTFLFRELDCVLLKGKEQGVKLFELVGDAASVPAEKRAVLDEFACGTALYRAGKWAEAIAIFDRLARGGDAPSATLLDRCRRFQAAPPPDWNGVFVMETK